MSDSVRPHRRQPTRLPCPWDSPGKNTGVGCHLLLQCMKVKSESEVTQSCPTIVTPCTAAYQAPLSMGFSRQDYWSGFPLPSPEEISGLSHSIVFLYFFALITEESFLISSCYSLELCIQMDISFLLLLCLLLLFFSQLFVKPPQTNILPFCIFFFLGMVLITSSCTMLQTSVHSSLGTLSDLIPKIYLLLPLYNR